MRLGLFLGSVHQGEGDDFWGPNCSTDGGTEFCFWGLFCIRGDMEFVFLAGRGDFCILIREYFEDWCRCIYTQQCITTPRAYTKNGGGICGGKEWTLFHINFQIY